MVGTTPDRAQLTTGHRLKERQDAAVAGRVKREFGKAGFAESEFFFTVLGLEFEGGFEGGSLATVTHAECNLHSWRDKKGLARGRVAQSPQLRLFADVSNLPAAGVHRVRALFAPEGHVIAIFTST